MGAAGGKGITTGSANTCTWQSQAPRGRSNVTALRSALSASQRGGRRPGGADVAQHSTPRQHGVFLPRAATDRTVDRA
jgi:hypothetical protein